MCHFSAIVTEVRTLNRIRFVNQIEAFFLQKWKRLIRKMFRAAPGRRSDIE